MAFRQLKTDSESVWLYDVKRLESWDNIFSSSDFSRTSLILICLKSKQGSLPPPLHDPWGGGLVSLVTKVQKMSLTFPLHRDSVTCSWKLKQTSLSSSPLFHHNGWRYYGKCLSAKVLIYCHFLYRGFSVQQRKSIKYQDRLDMSIFIFLFTVPLR